MAIETIRADRQAKLVRLFEAGMEAYPARTTRTHTGEQFLENHAILLKNSEEIVLAGRVMSMREHGGSLFVDIFDGTSKAQVYFQKENLAENAFEQFTLLVDTGDIIEAGGVAFTTKRGMPSLLGNSWRMLAKSLVPVPDQWFGIKDEEERYRKRYLDILLSKDLADRIRRRSVFWNTIRQFLLERDFVEVETPVLETTTGGAEARPFVTHHNALDMDVYLRISAGELWQKRLMVAGLPKVFEIGRIFRNEGMSSEHAQDYTQVEFYEAFKDYEAGMEMVTSLYRAVADKVYGSQIFSIKGVDVDLAKEWATYDFCALMREEYGMDPREAGGASGAAGWSAALEKKNIPFEKNAGIERLVDSAWKQIRKTISGPGFLINVPVYLEPLAKKSAKDPRVVERFQVMLAGSELGKGFSELNDPSDQAARFKRQQELREAGDEEAQMPDAEFVEALEYGMPPAFGFGVSERLFSFLEGVSIREAQIFPLLRRKG
ncbi:lysine--tRNA ligase [Candidatus Kaiserbacteria bacterium]|nr:lysine--tRNA ligase [Candidatus Kaiserbacteria bacterium]